MERYPLSYRPSKIPLNGLDLQRVQMVPSISDKASPTHRGLELVLPLQPLGLLCRRPVYEENPPKTLSSEGQKSFWESDLEGGLQGFSVGLETSGKDRASLGRALGWGGSV